MCASGETKRVWSLAKAAMFSGIRLGPSAMNLNIKRKRKSKQHAVLLQILLGSITRNATDTSAYNHTTAHTVLV